MKGIQLLCLYVLVMGLSTCDLLKDFSSFEVLTIAGSATEQGSDDGDGFSARFNAPNDITSNGIDLYITDKLNHTIRKMGITSTIVSTLAGSAGNSGSTDGVGDAARFNRPTGITIDTTNLYVVDAGNLCIRKIELATGTVSLFAGSPGNRGSTDGIGNIALFNAPEGISTDGTNLYVTDSGNSTIRQIVIATAEVTTLAGTANTYGSTNAIGPLARFSAPTGIFARDATLYVSDSGNHIIRSMKLDSNAVTTLAGNPGSIGFTDGIGSDARFNFPDGISGDDTTLSVADYGNHVIRRIILATGETSVIAGNAGVSGSVDGKASEAQFKNPTGILQAGSVIFVVDSGNHTIRLVRVAAGN